MSRLQMHIVPGPRKRTLALSDSPLAADEKSVSIHVEADDLVAYLKAKAEYEKWQERFRHQKRYGWGY